jgi:dTDP-4-dehydrorhamnose reductase
MNILVTGSNGQLGSELKKIAASLQNHHWFFTDINELDISSAEKVDLFCSENNIEVCIN